MSLTTKNSAIPLARIINPSAHHIQGRGVALLHNCTHTGRLLRLLGYSNKDSGKGKGEYKK